MTEAPIAELRVSDDAFDDPEQLRRRLADEGYLFFKGLQDADRLRALRRDILGVLMEGGWLVPGTRVEDGIARIEAKCAEGDPEYTGVYQDRKSTRLNSSHVVNSYAVFCSNNNSD